MQSNNMAGVGAGTKAMKVVQGKKKRDRADVLTVSPSHERKADESAKDQELRAEETLQDDIYRRKPEKKRGPLPFPNPHDSQEEGKKEESLFDWQVIPHNTIGREITSSSNQQSATMLTPVKLTLPMQAIQSAPNFEAVSSRPIRKPVPSIHITQDTTSPSSPSIKLSDGREIATIRTDFANLTKVSRPSLKSRVNSRSMQEEADRKGKGKSQEDRGESLNTSTSKDWQQSHRKTFGPDAFFTSNDGVGVIPMQLPRMSIVQEEDETAMNKMESNRFRRESTKSASLRRNSFESGTTALDTPNLERTLLADFGRAQEEILAPVRSHRRWPSTLVVPPSDVLEVAEPKSSISAVEGADSRYNFQTTPFDQQSRPTTGNSAFSRVIPITKLIKVKRPGTGESRTSEHVSNSQPRKLQREHGDKPSCRQCFRAGFECALHLHLGEGTAGRKTFQEFVANTGIFDDASLGDDSMVASQAKSRNNVMDHLGEIAFGESALSRPVTRGIVDDMLEERSRFLANLQQQKTVDKFLADLNKLKKDQDEEEEDVHVLQKDVMQEEEEGGKNVIKPVNTSAHPSVATPSDHIASVQRSAIGEYRKTSTGPDQLFFLADRWAKQRKIYHLLVFCLWIFALQCLDVGYNTASPFIANSFDQTSTFIRIGRLAFLVGEAIGLLFGVSFSSWGRLRISIVAIIAQGLLCVALGFIKASIVFTILRIFSGVMAGIFEIVAIGIVLDLVITRQQRAFGLASLLCFAVAGQIAGPWIAQLILKFVHWSWLYWIMSIYTVVYFFLFVLVIRETEPLTIYRANVAMFERQENKIWTPEPRHLPGFIEVLRYHMIQPYCVLLTQGSVILSGLVMAFSLGSLVLAFEGLGDVLVDRHHMTSALAKVTIMVSTVVGSLAAIFVLALLPSRGSSPFHTKAQRRSLYIDEKGLIDASRPAHDAEDLLRPAMGAIIIGAISLYTLALTSSTVNWIFSALSLALLSATNLLLVNSILNYLLESYYPATLTVLDELVAISDHLGPAPVMSMQAGHHHCSSSSPSDNDSRDEHTLMSGVNENGHRWSSEWSLCATSGAAGMTLIIMGAMTYLANLASTYISYSILMVIAASACLGISLLLVLLYRYGCSLRHFAFIRIAKREQLLWKQQRQENDSVQNSASRSGSRRHSPLGDQTNQEEDGVGSRLPQFILPRGKSSKAQGKHPKASRLIVSQPFNFLHVSTGHPTIPTPVLSSQFTPRSKPRVASGGYTIVNPTRPSSPLDFQQRNQQQVWKPFPPN